MPAADALFLLQPSSMTDAYVSFTHHPYSMTAEDVSFISFVMNELKRINQFSVNLHPFLTLTYVQSMAHWSFLPGTNSNAYNFYTVLFSVSRNNTKVFQIIGIYDSLGFVKTQGRSDFEQAQGRSGLNRILVVFLAPHIVELIKLSAADSFSTHYCIIYLEFLVCRKSFTLWADRIFHNYLKGVL